MNTVHNLKQASAVARYLALGWTPIPLNKGKGTNRRWKEATSGTFQPEDFAPEDNVGLVMRDGLVDIDIDNDLSQKLLGLMPPTAAFGRESTGVRHLLYQIVDPDNVVRVDLASDFGVKLDLRTTYRNLRTGKEAPCQTMAPPSIHPDSHEELVWFDRPEQPTIVSWAELHARFMILAAATEFLRVYLALEGLGGRHKICLDIAGVMRRYGWPLDLAVEVFQAVLDAAEEQDQVDRIRALTDTYNQEEDDAVTGIPTLVRHVDLVAPGSKLPALITHDSLPFSKPPRLADEELAEILEVDSMADQDMALLLHRLVGDTLARYQGGWYRFDPKSRDWLRLYDPPRVEVSKLTDVLKTKLEVVPSSAAKSLRNKIEYCRSSRGAMNILTAGQELFEATPLALGRTELLTKTHVVDFETGTARERTNEFCLLEPIPIEYDPQATCPLWERTMMECMLGDVAAYESLHQAIGMSLLPDGKEEKLIIWQGSGANGKSMAMRVLKRVLGRYVTQTPMEVLSGNQYRTTSALSLRDSRIAYIAEFKNSFNAGLVKQLTGSDAQSAYVLAKGQEEFPATWTTYLMTNEFPHFNKFDGGVARRLFLIQWRGDFRANPDLKLEEKLCSELPGIFNWCLEGYRKYRAVGALRMSPAAEMHVGEMIEDMDIVRGFVNDRIEFVNDSTLIEETEMLKAWQDWCSLNNILEGKSWTSRRLYRELEDVGIKRVTRRTSGNRKPFFGVSFKSELSSDQELEELRDLAKKEVT